MPGAADGPLRQRSSSSVQATDRTASDEHQGSRAERADAADYVHAQQAPDDALHAAHANAADARWGRRDHWSQPCASDGAADDCDGLHANPPCALRAPRACPRRVGPFAVSRWPLCACHCSPRPLCDGFSRAWHGIMSQLDPVTRVEASNARTSCAHRPEDRTAARGCLPPPHGALSAQESLCAVSVTARRPTQARDAASGHAGCSRCSDLLPTDGKHKREADDDAADTAQRTSWQELSL